MKSSKLVFAWRQWSIFRTNVSPGTWSGYQKAVDRFAAKSLVKRATNADYNPYTASEWADAVLRRCHRIPRDEHKGFDYRKLMRQLSEYFQVQSVSGLPFTHLRAPLGFTMGIVAKPLAAGRYSPLHTSAVAGSRTA